MTPIEMTPSNICYNLIRGEEKVRLKPYLDPDGVPTIGIGHTGTVTMNMLPITKEMAISLFKQDVSIAAKFVNLHYSGLRQCQFDSLVSLVFNVGGDGKFLKTRLSTWLKKDADDRHVAYNWIQFSLSSGSYKRGLLRRRIRELNLYYSWND